MTTVAQTPVTVSPRRTMTEAEFDAWMDEDIRAEWVDGEVVELMPEAMRHNALIVWLVTLIQSFADRNGLGTAFILNVIVRFPRRRRVPDLCFIARERLDIVKPTYIDGAPDLIVEIVSPD